MPRDNPAAVSCLLRAAPGDADTAQTYGCLPLLARLRNQGLKRKLTVLGPTGTDHERP